MAMTGGAQIFEVCCLKSRVGALTKKVRRLPPGDDGRSPSRGRFDRMSDDVRPVTGQGPLSVQEFVRKNAAAFTAATKANRGLSVCGPMRRQKDGFAVPSDAEWSTYDVIPLSSRLGARPNPLANWKHTIFSY
jgi:hypothetical protein